jgi:DNA modification methylase
MTIEYIDTGVIYREDNQTVLLEMPTDSVDLIYLDPPFFSNRNYEVIWGDEAEVRSFEDRWEGGIRHYIDWMHKRMLQLQRILRPTGSIYLHCDPHASHYLKVMMDEVFTAGAFRNEIIWKRTGAHGAAKRYAPVHDVIFYYSGLGRPTWNRQFHAYRDEYLSSKYRYSDQRGRYQLITLVPPGTRNGETGKTWRGINPTERGLHWRYPPVKLDELENEGMIVWGTRGEKLPRLKRYLKEEEGVPLQDVWTDISPLNSQARERLGYPTQKPEALLTRIIAASSNKGDTILDPFCGCGTTVSVAEQLSRRWIGIDISPTAVNLIERRMARMTPSGKIKILGMPKTEEALRTLKPFEFQNWVIQKFVGTHSPRKSGDMGIDGYSFMVNHPIQVKRSERVGRNVVDNFETAMRRGGHDTGYIVAFSFTRGAREEVARARWQDRLEIRLVTVRDLLKPRLDVRIPELASVTQLPLPPSRSLEARPSADELIQSDLSAG